MIKYFPYLAIIFAALLWSADALLRQSLYTISPLLIITLEHGIGALIFLPLLKKFWPEIKKLRQSGWISILWISLLGGICGTYFYTKALSYVGYIDLSVVVLLQKFQPVFAMSLAAIILKEKLSTRYLILAMMAIIGGYFITFGNNSLPNWDDNSLIAALFALLAAFCWGSSTAIGKKAMIDLHKEGIIPHLQVHDELDISVQDPKQAEKIKEIMESTVTLEVPNKVDYEEGDNWGSIK